MSYTFDGVTNTSGVFTHAAGTGLSYSVTDVNMCTAATGTFTVVQPAAISVTGVTQTTIACNGGTATVTITATGGTGTLSYTFDGVTNTSGVFTHAAGTSLSYSVTDVKSCGPITGTFTVVQPTPLNATSVTYTNATCAGSASGSITINGATGGSGNYEFSINGTSWQGSPSFIAGAGTYYVYMRDAVNTGCTKLLAANLTITEALHTDVTIGSEASNSLFANNGDEKTVVYNLTEIAGKSATAAVVRIFKPAGYLINFSTTQTTALGYTLDNFRWLKINENSSYVEYARTGADGNNTINCNEQLRIAFTLQRNTPNISKFNLNTQFRPAATELRLTNNTNSIVFTGE